MYRVTKHINGHDYFYDQRTFRVGDRVKTISRYVGPVMDTAPLSGRAVNTTQQAVSDTLDFLDFGPLPIGAIRRIFGRRLAPGSIGFYTEGQEHAIDRHFDRHSKADGAIFEKIRTGLASPAYIGQSQKHRNAIEVYYQYDNNYYLIAVSLHKDANGHYRAATIFWVKEKEIKTRFSAGRIHKLFG